MYSGAILAEVRGRGGIDNIVCWFHICGNVYARKQVETPDITKEEGEEKVNMCTVDRYEREKEIEAWCNGRFDLKDETHNKPKGTVGMVGTRKPKRKTFVDWMKGRVVSGVGDMMERIHPSTASVWQHRWLRPYPSSFGLGSSVRYPNRRP